MQFRFTIFFVSLIFLCVGNAQAEIYTCKDIKGNVIYTDSPAECANAEEIKVDTLPTLVPSKSLTLPRSNSSSAKQDDKDSYNEIAITSPSNDATIRDNQGNLTINFRATPALQTRKGHKFVVSVDGKEVYSGTSTITALKNVDRGTHVIAVKVVAPDGTIKASATPVKFTLQRFSALNNVNSNSTDANAGNDNAGSGPETTITNQKFPSNSKFNRPATPPPPPASGANN